MEKNKKNNRVLQTILTMCVLIWMLVVFLFSNQDGTKTLETSSSFIYFVESAVNSDNVIEDKIEQAPQKESKEIRYKYSQKVQSLVRKNAHYFLYAIGGFILSAFFYAFFKDELKLCKTNFSKYIFCANIIGILYAITDEIHQKFVPGRTGSIKDVGIDSLGVITGILLFVIMKTLIIKRKNRKKMGE